MTDTPNKTENNGDEDRNNTDLMDLDLMKCEAGNVVVLRSGGPSMTVVKVEGETVHCIWFTADENVRTAELPLIALDPADDFEDFDFESFEGEERGVEIEHESDDEAKKKKKKKKKDDDGD